MPSFLSGCGVQGVAGSRVARTVRVRWHARRSQDVGLTSKVPIEPRNTTACSFTGYLFTNVGMPWEGVGCRDLRLPQPPLETRLTHFPTHHVPFGGMGGLQKTAAASLHCECAGNLATINGAACEHQFATANGRESYSGTTYFSFSPGV